jgi:23S rRNA pseudouridine2457 synthase
MTAAVGFPTLRLVRFSMEKITISGMEVGEIREMDQESVYRALGLTGFVKVNTPDSSVKKNRRS